MTNWPCNFWLQKKRSMTHQQGSFGGVLQTFMHQVVDGILCTLSPHHVHRENGVYQQWTTYALKSKSVPEMHFPAIWRSKFTDLANSKKTQSLGKNGCRQKCLDKSLILNKKNTFSILTNISVVLHNLLQYVWIKHFTKIYIHRTLHTLLCM